MQPSRIVTSWVRPGLSFFIETAEKKILFDTGLSGLFFTNAEKMGISLRDLDFLILSHGHSDHTGGLAALSPVPCRCTTGGESAPAATSHRPPPLLLAKRKKWREKRLINE